MQYTYKKESQVWLWSALVQWHLSAVYILQEIVPPKSDLTPNILLETYWDVDFDKLGIWACPHLCWQRKFDSILMGMWKSKTKSIYHLSVLLINPIEKKNLSALSTMATIKNYRTKEQLLAHCTRHICNW